MNEGYPSLHIVDRDISASHVDEFRLNLHTHDPDCRPSSGQEDGDNGIARSKIDDHVGLFEAAEVGQKNRVNRKAIAPFFLNYPQLPVQKPVHRLVRLNRDLQCSPSPYEMGYLNYHIRRQAVNMTPHTQETSPSGVLSLLS